MHFDGNKFISIGMSSADIREIAACGFQIGMIAGYTGFAQLFCLLYSQNAQRSANFNMQFFFNTFQGTADIFKVIGLALSATAGNDGEAYSACFLSFFAALKISSSLSRPYSLTPV